MHLLPITPFATLTWALDQLAWKSAEWDADQLVVRAATDAASGLADI